MNPFSATLMSALLLSSSVVGQVPAAYEIPPIFHASEVLSPGLMRGPHHRVRDLAPSDGYQTHFTIDSDYGMFECVGRGELEERVREIGAIAKLVEVSKSDLFAEGLKQSIEAPIDAVKNIAEHPKESLKQVPSTVGHFFKKVGSSVGNAARKVGENFNDADGGDGTGEAMANTGRGIGNAAKSVAGFDQAKLNCARQLGVDPYSDNARLQDEMEKITWAFFAGGLPLRVGAMAVSGGASAALTATKTVGLPEDIYDTTPGELALRDREAMMAMGASEDLINRAFLNPVLTISLRHGIVESLTRLPGNAGKVKMLEVAVGMDQRRQTMFLNQSLVMLVNRHKNQPYASLRPYGRLPGAITPEGDLEVAAPVDYVSWTEQVAGFASRGNLGDVRRRLILGGGLSPMADGGFKRTGWTVISMK